MSHRLIIRKLRKYCPIDNEIPARNATNGSYGGGDRFAGGQDTKYKLQDTIL